MSHESSQSLEHLPPPPAQAEEGIRWFAVIGVGIASLLVFAIATFVAYRYMNLQEKALQPLGPDPVPAIITSGQPEIGIVDQVPFDMNRSAQVYRMESLERLSSWGWVDRGQGLIHMPIDRAMELVVEQQKEQKK
ncbi:MAG TPA: hypothetical protein VII08_19115 [Myxococcales bacterium]